jgi:hypothetical protein
MRCELTKNYRHQIRIISCFILSALDRWFQSLIRVWLDTHNSVYLGEGPLDFFGYVNTFFSSQTICFHTKQISDYVFHQMSPQFLVYNVIELRMILLCEVKIKYRYLRFKTSKGTWRKYIDNA